MTQERSWLAQATRAYSIIHHEKGQTIASKREETYEKDGKVNGLLQQVPKQNDTL